MAMIGAHWARGAAAFLVILAQLAAGAAFAAERPAMVIVFDSTNSMWGQIDGTNKVVLLRQALGHAFENAEGKLDIGLISYGTSEAEACTAVKTVKPLGPVKAEEYSRAVNTVVLGKGGTPLARALNEATALVNSQRQPASIVVISDGLDNCHADPCATAAQLKAQSPNLIIHAIAFDKSKKDELTALECLAKKTGGAFFSATNGDELESALSAVVAFAAEGTRPVDAKESAELPMANGPREAGAEPSTPSVTAAEETTVPLSPEAPDTDDAKSTAAKGVPRPSLRPAISVPEAREDEHEQQVAKIETDATGTLRLSASLTEDLPPITTGLIWRVFAAKPDEDGSFKVVARRTDAEPKFTLRAGDYVVHVAYGRAKAAKQITVKDDVIEERLVLNAGGLRLSAVGPDGQTIPANAVSYAVYSSEQDQFGQRKLILPLVPPGKIVRLNAGTYRIVSQYGDANAVVRADVTVEAGQLAEAVVTHEAAKVTLKLVNEPGGEALADTSWSVQTPDGDVVAQSVGAFPTHILAPGTYTVVARHDGIAYARKYTVELGYDQEVEIVADRNETDEQPLLVPVQ
jgi:von Willebrand factor type A domain